MPRGITPCHAALVECERIHQPGATNTLYLLSFPSVRQDLSGRAVIYDTTRLGIRVLSQSPNGIDRVDFQDDQCI